MCSKFALNNNKIELPLNIKSIYRKIFHPVSYNDQADLNDYFLTSYPIFIFFIGKQKNNNFKHLLKNFSALIVAIIIVYLQTLEVHHSGLVADKEQQINKKK